MYGLGPLPDFLDAWPDVFDWDGQTIKVKKGHVVQGSDFIGIFRMIILIIRQNIIRIL